jgi:lipoprotein-releasing system permease protein
MRTILYVALRQLWAKKGLNTIAMCGVALGVTMLIAVNAMMAGFQEKFLTTILQVSPHVTILDRRLAAEPPRLAALGGGPVVAEVAHESPGDRPLYIRRPVETIRAIEAMPGVVAASGTVAGSGVISFGAKEYPVEIRGIDPERQERVTPLSPFVIDGDARALAARADGALLGSGVATRVGAKVGDVILAIGPRGEKLVLKVIALFETGVSALDQSRVYVPLKSAGTLLSRPDTVSRVEVRLANESAAPGFADRFEQAFGYDAESWQEQNASFLGLFAQQAGIISFVVGAILTVGGFGILAVQIMIVLQKTRDIAILRSYGFMRRDILAIFLLQGGVLSLLGGAVGGLAGHGLVILVGGIKMTRDVVVKSDHLLMHEEPRMYVLGLLFSLAVGLLASFIPALRGARVEPVDVLRGQIA